MMANGEYSSDGGSFASLSNGRIFYRWQGDPKGPVLVLVHGLTTPSFVWRDMLPDLIQAGFRILTFDHFGRGFSDCPKQPQTPEFFIQELGELLDALDITIPIHLLGYSMGGGIVAGFAAQRAARVDHLILLAPCGFQVDMGSFFRQIRRLSVIGDVMMALFGGRLFRRGARASAHSEGVDAQMIAMQCHETRRPGFAAAVLSSMRYTTSKNMHNEHQQIMQQDVPTLAIFGSNDAIIPISSASGLRKANQNAAIVEIEGAGHRLVFTHANRVNRAILNFLA